MSLNKFTVQASKQQQQQQSREKENEKINTEIPRIEKFQLKPILITDRKRKLYT